MCRYQKTYWGVVALNLITASSLSLAGEPANGWRGNGTGLWPEATDERNAAELIGSSVDEHTERARGDLGRFFFLGIAVAGLRHATNRCLKFLRSRRQRVSSDGERSGLGRSVTSIFCNASHCQTPSGTAPFAS